MAGMSPCAVFGKKIPASACACISGQPARVNTRLRKAVPCAAQALECKVSSYRKKERKFFIPLFQGIFQILIEGFFFVAATLSADTVFKC